MERSDKAVILARGLGTRMRKAASAALSDAQAAVAQTGVKAMIPIKRPFLDYVLSALADAGWRHVCLVIGPEHQALRDYYAAIPRRRVHVDFAIQEKPLGTANAVAAAEAFAAGEHFLCINSDNYYPADALEALQGIEGMGLAGFDPEAMIAGGNIPPDRIGKFAVVRIGPGDRMDRIIEKPQAAVLASLPRPLYVSMNCWRLGPRIFDACRAIGPSPRGEFELPDAVQHCVAVLGETFHVVRCHSPVLDLSSREDVAAVTEKLLAVEVDL